MAARLELTRAQILRFRRRVGALEERLPAGPRSLRTAAWAGLQDSVPRAALLSIHARVEGAHPEIWDDDAFVQVWGPRWATYVVPAEDYAIFTVGRHPDGDRGRERAESWAARISRREPRLGVLKRYATTTGTVLIRWDGARAPDVWTVPRPTIEPLDARRELARRYLHVFGPGTSASFAKWAGLTTKEGSAAFDGLELVPVRTPLGDEAILARDEALILKPAERSTSVRLLPSGDAYWLFYDAARRAFLLPDRRQRDALWTPRVWPGALLVAGEIAGTWRRQRTEVSLEPWRRLARTERDAIDAEIASLPLRVA
jgi:Winged helix DNA-binding domain